jgi:hypothetical protein
MCPNSASGVVTWPRRRKGKPIRKSVGSRTAEEVRNLDMGPLFRIKRVNGAGEGQLVCMRSDQRAPVVSKMILWARSRSVNKGYGIGWLLEG